MLALFPLLALAIIAVAFLKLEGASAASGVHAHHGTTKLNNSASRNAGSNLIYHGGPEMDGTTNVYAIFWEPTGSFVSATYNSLISRYFNDVGVSTDYAITRQYHDTSGTGPNTSVLAGSWMDTATYPSGTLSDGQVQNEVTHAQNVNHWSSSIHNIFFVFTAKGENICIDASTCSFTTFCAYHSFFGSNTIYAAMPYTGTSLAGCGVPHTPNHDIDADSTINVSSHEQMEAATDPLLNAWFDGSGQENGDKCNFNFAPTNSAGGDTLMNGHPYEVQKEWSNARHACRLNAL